MTIRTIVLQAGLLATLGAGLKVLRTLTAPALHADVAAHTALVCGYPALALAVSQMAAAAPADAFEDLLSQVVHIVALDRGTDAASQWHISRLNDAVLSRAKHMCQLSSATASDDEYRQALFCQEDVVPRMRTALDDLLHNHLLARR